MRQTELHLSEEDRSTIEAIRSKGVHHAREVNRAHVLSCLDRDISESQIMAVLGIGRTAVWRARAAYLQGGVELAVFDVHRSGRPCQYDNNPRYVVTNLDAPAQQLYDEVYCQRGEAENRIKEAQVGLFATRTSCQHFQSNQLRMLLAALGYVLIERLRALALQGTQLATAQVDTLRIKLLKVAAVITRNTRRIRLYLASNWPSADVFEHAVQQLRSP